VAEKNKGVTDPWKRSCVTAEYHDQYTGRQLSSPSLAAAWNATWALRQPDAGDHSAPVLHHAPTLAAPALVDRAVILILAVSLALGGLAYGTLNVVSLGFARFCSSGEDFGSCSTKSRARIRTTATRYSQNAAPDLLVGAYDCGAFLLLNLSGMPGLGQLGTLVAIAWLRQQSSCHTPICRLSREKPFRCRKQHEKPGKPDGRPPLDDRDAFQDSWLLTLVLIIAGIPFLMFKPPRFDKSPRLAQAEDSQAYAALDELKLQRNRAQEPLWVVIEGVNEQQVETRLKQVEPILKNAVSTHAINSIRCQRRFGPRVNNQHKIVLPLKSS